MKIKIRDNRTRLEYTKQLIMDLREKELKSQMGRPFTDTDYKLAFEEMRQMNFESTFMKWVIAILLGVIIFTL